MPLHDPADDAAWAAIKAEWTIQQGTIYLNHGSFGPPPNAVRAARQQWQELADCQPMDFFVRRLEPAWRAARDRVASLLTHRRAI